MRRALLMALATTLMLAGGSSAIGAGSLSASPDPVDFGAVAVGEAHTIHVDLTNDPSATLPVTITSVGTSGGGGDLSIPSDSCSGSTLSPGQSCGVNVTYQPSSTGSLSGASLDLVDDDVGNLTPSFAIHGSGVPPVAVQPASLSFGPQRVGTTSASQPVTVTNNQSSSTSLNTGKSGPNIGDFQLTDGCGATLAANSSCNILIAFAPTAQGSRGATLNIAGQAVGLGGTGIAPGIALSTGSIAFGNQPVFTASSVQTVTVTNTGTDALSVGQAAVTTGAIAQFPISDTCFAASPLPPGGQCTVSVQFTPIVTGSLSATLTVPSELGPQTVALTGTGRPSAIVFKPVPIVFKKARKAGTASNSKTVSLVNRTNGPLSISNVALAGVNPRSFRMVSGTCQGATLPANGTCSETVKFAPNEVGAKSASLTVTDNGPNSPHSLSLQGRAIPPANDRSVHGAVGCSSVRITWRNPTGRRYANTLIVRAKGHIPTGTGDGVVVEHTARAMNESGLKHFTTYYYRVFALYHSHVRPGTLNHSRGTILRERTGEICAPKQNGVVRDATPTATWLPQPSLFGYAFRLFHAGHQVQQKVRIHSTRFTFRGGRRLHHGLTYTLYLYAYPESKPAGVLIGQARFHVR
ncbi:MAG TPA: choice-of-anchor D domain-containing protein [Gaiellales bacterium]|jgi:hypothetical protein|nr:choice-of-anchor D domain-containing protein [Gaiellales bacterium]